MGKVLSVLFDIRLTVNQQCTLAAKEVSSILGCIRLSVASRLREGILPLSTSGVTPECCVQFWAPQYKRVMDLLE